MYLHSPIVIVHLGLYYLCNVSGIPGAKTLLFNLKKCKNILKIENRGCHGNGGEDKNLRIFVHHSAEVKNRQSFRKIYFFYFQPILTVTEYWCDLDQGKSTLVIPLAEYASTVWDPYTQTNVQKLEMVQQRAARYVKNRHRNTSSVSDMLSTMNWRSLQDRRRDARLCMLYKPDRNLVAIMKDKRL